MQRALYKCGMCSFINCPYDMKIYNWLYKTHTINTITANQENGFIIECGFWIDNNLYKISEITVNYQP